MLGAQNTDTALLFLHAVLYFLAKPSDKCVKEAFSAADISGRRRIVFGVVLSQSVQSRESRRRQLSHWLIHFFAVEFISLKYEIGWQPNFASPLRGVSLSKFSHS